MTENTVDSGYKGKKALITGGLGFIGSNIAEELINIGAEVFIVDNLSPYCGGNRFNLKTLESHPNIHIYEGDMGDEQLMGALLPKIDFIFNMAGHVCHIESMKNPQVDRELNLINHIRMLELCKEYNPKIKIGYASTRGVYGRPKIMPIDENAPIIPIDFNGIHKYSAEQYHLLYNQLYGIRSFIIRLTNTYGPKMSIKDSKQGFICLFIKQALKGETIRVFGTGEQKRDFNYISDVTKAFLKCMITPETDGQVFNIGGEKSVSVLECGKRIIGHIGRSELILQDYPEENKRIEIGDYKADLSKIRRVIRWDPEVSFEEGIVKTLDYYKRHKEEYW